MAIILGTCVQLSSTEFECLCATSWTGYHCETKINYCINVTCKNQGVCRSRKDGYECICLTPSYSGSLCESVDTKLSLQKQFNQSFAFIAIIFLASVFIFVLTLDFLKFVLQIDVTEQYKIRRRPRYSRIRRAHTIVRYNYVN